MCVLNGVDWEWILRYFALAAQWLPRDRLLFLWSLSYWAGLCRVLGGIIRWGHGCGADSIFHWGTQGSPITLTLSLRGFSSYLLSLPSGPQSVTAQPGFNTTDMSSQHSALSFSFSRFHTNIHTHTETHIHAQNINVAFCFPFIHCDVLFITRWHRCR